MSQAETRSRRKVRQGRVIQNAMNKSIVVQVDRKIKHPLYGKPILRSTKLYAHDEKNEANVGDTVRLMETRPLSKLKRWRLLEIVERAK
jgi:small subunit ribosomal protein S17